MLRVLQFKHFLFFKASLPLRTGYSHFLEYYCPPFTLNKHLQDSAQTQRVPSVFFSVPKTPSPCCSYLIVLLLYFHLCFLLQTMNKDDVLFILIFPAPSTFRVPAKYLLNEFV